MFGKQKYNYSEQDATSSSDRSFWLPATINTYLLSPCLPPRHALMFWSSQYARSFNADTDFAQAPPVESGRVLRNIIRRILYLRRRFGPRARTVLRKIDVTEAFRQVSVQWAGAPVFGYVFRELVVADRRLQFGWRSSPGVFCLFSAALEHVHRHTSYDGAVVMEQGRTATDHVSVTH